MIKKRGVYKDGDKGIVVEALSVYKETCELASCCGETMLPCQEKTADQGREKHVPVVEKTERGYKVVVGSTRHPMLPEHWIEWIELVTEGGYTLRRYLSAQDAPEAVFETMRKPLVAREYCNKHGLWKVDL